MADMEMWFSVADTHAKLSPYAGAPSLLICRLCGSLVAGVGAFGTDAGALGAEVRSHGSAAVQHREWHLRQQQDLL